MAGRSKLPDGQKKVPIVTNTMFSPSELEKFGGVDIIKERIKKAIQKEFKKAR